MTTFGMNKVFGKWAWNVLYERRQLQRKQNELWAKELLTAPRILSFRRGGGSRDQGRAAAQGFGGGFEINYSNIWK